MQQFYRPLISTAQDKYCIIYPARDDSHLESVLARDQRGILETTVEDTVRLHAELFQNTDYMIVIVWNIEDEVMLDIWSFELSNTSESSPLVVAYTFKNKQWVKDLGTASGDSLILLGQEELLRRRHQTLELYLADDSRHKNLPPECRADENYYV